MGDRRVWIRINELVTTATSKSPQPVSFPLAHVHALLTSQRERCAPEEKESSKLQTIKCNLEWMFDKRYSTGEGLFTSKNGVCWTERKLICRCDAANNQTQLCEMRSSLLQHSLSHLQQEVRSRHHAKAILAEMRLESRNRLAFTQTVPVRPVANAGLLAASGGTALVCHGFSFLGATWHRSHIPNLQDNFLLFFSRRQIFKNFQYKPA